MPESSDERLKIEGTEKGKERTFSVPLSEWQWLHSVARLLRKTHSYQAFKTGNRYAHCLRALKKLKSELFQCL